MFSSDSKPKSSSTDLTSTSIGTFSSDSYDNSSILRGFTFFSNKKSSSILFWLGFILDLWASAINLSIYSFLCLALSAL